MGFDSCDETHWMLDDEGDTDDDIDFDVAAVCDDDDVGGGPKWSTPLPQPQNQKKFQSKGCGMGKSIPRRSPSQATDAVDMSGDGQLYVRDGERLDVEPTVTMGGMRPDFDPVVVVERGDSWKESDGSLRVLTEVEKEVLDLLRKVRDDGEWKEGMEGSAKHESG